MRNIFKSLTIVAVMLAASNVSAAIISDFVDIHQVNHGYLLLNRGQSYTITHDLSDNGVPDDFSVESAWLRVGLADDLWDPWFQSEIALISGPGVNSGNLEVGGNIFQYDYRYVGVGYAGLDALNATGQLQVTITSLYGDFYWKNSELFAYITPVNVSEPATLALLGIGILGLGLARRRKDA